MSIVNLSRLRFLLMRINLQRRPERVRQHPPGLTTTNAQGALTMAKAQAKPTITFKQPDTIEGCGDVIWRALQFTAYRNDIGDREKPDAQDIEFKKRELLDLQNHCEARIGMMLAKTPQDALIQLALLAGEIDGLESPELEEFERRREHRKITRAIHSLMRWIEAAHGTARHAVCNHYLDKDRDPWDAVTN